MFFIWIIIGLFIYYLYKDHLVTNINMTKSSNAAEILKQRYVNGEMDDEAYERMNRIIKD